MSARQWAMKRQQLLREISRLTSPLAGASTRGLIADLLKVKKLSQQVAEIERLMVNSIPESLPDVVAALGLGLELASTSCSDLRLPTLLTNAISGCERLSCGQRAIGRSPRSQRPRG
jgi:hypothetical protein